MRFDSTGKVSLDHIYTEPDPRAFFETLHELDYLIPQHAKPYFTDLIADYRAARRVDVPQIVDVGCSYGVNPALLRCDLSMAELYGRYAAAGPDAERAELIAADRQLVRASSGIRARFIGLDISQPALRYAKAAGFVDDVVLADLERNELTPHQRSLLDGTDLIVSTGCLGYVGGTTLARVVEASGRGASSRPWMAHFVLRMFPWEPIEASLAGYRTVRIPRLFRQRRFVSTEEQEQVLDTLLAVGVDPSGWETDGWFYAQLYLSRPRGEA